MVDYTVVVVVVVVFVDCTVVAVAAVVVFVHCTVVAVVVVFVDYTVVAVDYTVVAVGYIVVQFVGATIGAGILYFIATGNTAFKMEEWALIANEWG